jgi:DNA-binding Lrp family transcriptional regulator
MELQSDIQETDYKLIMELQYNFPISERPYLEIGRRLGITEDEVIFRIKNLIDKEVIKRIGMYVNFRSKGMVGALVASNIKTSNLDSFRRMALRIREITHNFVRDHPRFNVWFVIKDYTREDLSERVNEILKKVECNDYVILFSKKNLKLSVKYNVIEGVSMSGDDELTPEHIPTAEEIGINNELLKQLSYPLPLSSRPFKDLADKISISEENLIDLVLRLRKLHVIKDYGATINGEKVGIKENAMVLINSDDLEKGCINIATNVKEATHVVLREADKEWDYLCYAMIHGKDKRVISQAARKIVSITSAKSYMTLYSMDNLKPGVVI